MCKKKRNCSHLRGEPAAEQTQEDCNRIPYRTLSGQTYPKVLKREKIIIFQIPQLLCKTYISVF